MKRVTVLIARAATGPLLIVGFIGLLAAVYWSVAVVYAWVIRDRVIDWPPFAAVAVAALVLAIGKACDDYQFRNQQFKW